LVKLEHKLFYARPIVIWFSIYFFSRKDLFPEAVLNLTNSQQQPREFKTITMLVKWTLNNNKAYKVYGHCCCFEFNFIGIVIVEEKLIWHFEIWILEKDENNFVTLNFCLHISRNTKLIAFSTLLSWSSLSQSKMIMREKVRK
jgi:hypothetical protein